MTNCWTGPWRNEKTYNTEISGQKHSECAEKYVDIIVF